MRVEAVIGRVASSGAIEDTTVLTLPFVENRDGQHCFERQFIPHQTGRLGYALRISPDHFEDPLTRPTHALMKWA